MLGKTIRLFASLRLTVALMSLAMVLIFVGTLAQTRLGIWETVDTYFRSPIAWVDLQLLIPAAVARVDWQIPFPGGTLIGVLILVNLLAAHWTRFRLKASRLGVLILHAGLIVLIVGEFVTARFADEGMMSIDVGGSSSYVEDLRTTELAVIDLSETGFDRVVTLSESMLVSSKRLTDPRLPFDIEVVQWVPNARLLRAHGPTPADRGAGRESVLEEMPKARGVDGAQTDSPAAYIRLHRDGQSLGTWLVWANLIDAQPVEVNGQAFEISLRFKRTYKPYELHLLEFRHDKFVGTEIAMNFSSRVRIIDPETGTDREVLIWMNNPLRYRGATFYQASYKPDGSGTVLQVVRNPGAVLPYVACVLVAGGMVIHFGMVLAGFLRRRSADQTNAHDLQLHPAVSAWRRALPWTMGAVGIVIACWGLVRPVPVTEYDMDTFGRLPVSSGGRVKPMDTAARHALRIAGGRQSVQTEDGQTITATQFLIDLMARPEAVRDLPVVRVDHPDVLSMIGRRPEEGGRLGLSAIEPYWELIHQQAARVLDIDAKRRDPFQRELLKLYHAVHTLLAHARMLEPYVIAPLAADQQWRSFDEAFLASGLALPPGHPGEPVALADVHPAVAYYITMMTAYSEQDAATFNRSVTGYEALLRRDLPATMRRTDLEVLFNRASLFVGATVVYLIAGILMCVSMLMRLGDEIGDNKRSVTAGLHGSAVGLICAAFVVHTAAILLRIYLQDRPPVTNLYSSAVFVGWAAVLFGLILERLYPLGMAGLGAAVVGFTTLIIAHNLGSDGDTMQMMQAVLDSNFWLATHVTTITLGYSATFLAGAMAMVYLVLGIFTRLLTRQRAEALSKMVYGVVCFALLLSFVGTVLGGIWADQSWGRFWGWDPKENGAALVVLINAIILHARWGGIIQHRGIMVLAVAGNIVTAWSWFGTNMLGIGLHAYGFMDSAVFWLIAFVITQFILMSIGLLPHAVWRSDPRRPQPLPRPQPEAERPVLMEHR